MKVGTTGFVGARLKEAREARGMTAATLADLVRISGSAVSQYENGKQTPSPEVLGGLADALKIPIHRLLRPAEEQPESTVFFRSLHSATKSSRVRAKRRYHWLREVVQFLRTYVTFPVVRIPKLDVPDDPRALSDEDIERFATQTRRLFGLGDGPISNVLWLVENYGAIVARHELFADKLDAFSEWRPNDEAPFIILGTDKGSAVRSRFDVSHELGHLILHRSVPENLFNQPAVFKLIESQANRFAGAFLLPARSFASESTQWTPSALVQLKPKWKAAIALMLKRASDLDLISQPHQTRMWINLARRGWKTKEPLDDRIPPEEPRLIRQSFDVVVNSNRIERHDIPFYLALNSEDVERVAGLSPGFFGDSRVPLELKPDAPIHDDAPGIIRFPRKA